MGVVLEEVAARRPVVLEPTVSHSPRLQLAQISRVLVVPRGQCIWENILNSMVLFVFLEP
jgi:hypothetical protein